MRDIHLIPQKYKESWHYNEQLYLNKLDNLKEIEFLEAYSLPRLHKEEIENLNRTIMNKTWISNQKPCNKEKSKTSWFHWWILQNLKQI